MLTKGDKVVMHTCGEAQHYDGKIWTCRTDEYTTGEGVYKQNLVFLEGFSGCFLADYLQKVNVPEQLLAEVRAKDAEIEKYRKEAMNERKLSADIVGEREELIIENERLKDAVATAVETLERIINIAQESMTAKYKPINTEELILKVAHQAIQSQVSKE